MAKFVKSWDGCVQSIIVHSTNEIDGIQILAEKIGIIDLKRVAVRGWSYGGYASLMCLVQRPDLFRIAIAGGPVTAWELYDTGYTERYMGLPSDNPEGYRRGCLLDQIANFPDEPNRILIFHGMIDENVHFTHTSALVTGLMRARKPYQLQVFPTERHAVRSPSLFEHMETMTLWFLQENM